MSTLLQDVRYALRTLWHQKAFATVAILCLGFGIGLNTTIFSILDGILFQPYPYPEPDRIVVLGTRNPSQGINTGLAYQDMQDWKRLASSITTIAAFSGRSFSVSDGTSEPVRVAAGAVTPDLFPLLGAFPVLGRGIETADDQPGAEPVALISHDLWTARFEADPAIIGRRLLVDGEPHSVVGIMPEGFRFPEEERLWVPLGPLAHAAPRTARNLFAFARLAPGVSFDRMTEELGAVAATLGREYPATNAGWTVRPRTLREVFVPGDVTLVLTLMMAAVTLVLFVACSNVANLLLARASVRKRELAVRAALGAGRGRLMRQLLTESVVLGLLAVPLGLVLATAGTRLIWAAVPADSIPYYIHFDVDGRSLAYSIVIAGTTALVFGLFPALHVIRGWLREHLTEGSRGNTASRSLVRSGLVVVQVSLAVVALVGALLFVRSFSNLDNYQFGFSTDRLMTMRFFMTGPAYETPETRLERVQQIVGRIRALPGVEEAFASNLVPLGGGGGGGTVVIDGGEPAAEGQNGIEFVTVTSGFHRTLDVALTGGREFAESEGFSRMPVAVINSAMARRFWPDGNAVGGRFRMTNNLAAGTDWFTVVGVAPDVRVYGVNPDSFEVNPMALVPYAYQPSSNTGLTIRMVAGDPTAIVPGVRAILQDVDPALAMSQVQSMDDLRRLSYWEFELYGWIFGTTGVVGLLLAAIGVYGVISYSVAQRTQEVGVRVALGASRREILRLIVSQGLWLVGIGLAAGLALALIAMPWARSFLFQVSPFDPVSFAAVAALLGAVALVASYIPARRATQVDPIIVLRGE